MIDGWNAERILLAAEAIGDGYWFIERAAALRQRARGLRPPDRRQPGRAVPDRPRLHAGPRRRPDALRGRRAVRRAASPAARRRTWPSCSPPRRAGPPRTPAWTPTAATASSTDYDVERKFRETRLYKVAPVNNNLVTSFIATKVLGLPRSVLNAGCHGPGGCPVQRDVPQAKGSLMKIVVIGGTGLIGSKLVDEAGEHGHEAVAGVARHGREHAHRRRPGRGARRARPSSSTSPTRRRSRTRR